MASARLVGTLTFTELHCRGELRFGPDGRLSLDDLGGRAVLRAELCTGPLRFPLRVTFCIERAGDELSFQPLRGAGLFWLLGPFVAQPDAGGAWHIRRGRLYLDLRKATKGAAVLTTRGPRQDEGA